MAKTVQPSVPIIIVSAHSDETRAAEALNDGAFGYVSKDELWRLTFILSRLSAGRPLSADDTPPAPDIVTAFEETG